MDYLEDTKLTIELDGKIVYEGVGFNWSIKSDESVIVAGNGEQNLVIKMQKLPKEDAKEKEEDGR